MRSRDRGIVGEVTVDFIQQFKVDIGLIGISAIEADGTLRDFDYREVKVARAIIEHSREVWLAADHSKFNRPAMVELGAAGPGGHAVHRPAAARAVSAPAGRGRRQPERLQPQALTKRIRQIARDQGASSRGEIDGLLLTVNIRACCRTHTDGHEWLSEDSQLTVQPKNSSYPGAASVGGVVGRLQRRDWPARRDSNPRPPA